MVLGRRAKSPKGGASTDELFPVPRRRANNQPQVPFAYKLVLNQWLLSLFNVETFKQLAEYLRNEKLEGLDENNVHHFHHALTAQLFNLTQLPTGLLLEYDQNIVTHTLRLNDRRITRGDPRSDSLSRA
jgi:hypothetical protein